VRIGFVGEFGPNRVSPRELTSSLISSLVNVEGIVTKCSLVRPKIVESVHYAEATGQFIHKTYRWAHSSGTGLSRIASELLYPLYAQRHRHPPPSPWAAAWFWRM